MSNPNPNILFDLHAREDKPWPNPRMGNGAIVGHVTDTTARLWVRIRDGHESTLVVAEAEQGSLPPAPFVQRLESTDQGALVTEDGIHRLVWHGSAQFPDEHDRTHVFDVTGLRPGSRFFYGVGRMVDGIWHWLIGRDEDHGFRTQPAAPAVGAVRFGAFSCHMPYPSPRAVANMHMFDALFARLRACDADFVLGVGDQVYSDGNEDFDVWRLLRRVHREIVAETPERQHEIMTSWYRDVYRGYWGHLALRRVLRSFPTYMMWDDHEICDGWGSRTDEETCNLLDSWWRWEDKVSNRKLANEMYRAARRAYREYQGSHNPNKGQRTDDALDYDFQWARTAVYVLDLRSERKTWKDDSTLRSIVLGDAQERRLATWLAARTSDDQTDVIVVVSPVPLIHCQEWIIQHAAAGELADDLRDQWGHRCHREERERVLTAMFEAAEANKVVVCLSGDVHMGAAFELVRGQARVYQLTSSAISNPRVGHPLLQEAIAASTGWLADPPTATPATRTWVRRHRVFGRNNFALLECHRDERGPRLQWQICSAEANGELTYLPPLVLRPTGVE